MITYEKKDITTTGNGVIAHGVNCQGAMGSGVALAIMRKWPEIRKSYMEYKPSPQLLGTVDFVDVDPMGLLQISTDVFAPYNLIVANCFTQEFFGGDGKVYASVDAVRECLNNVYAFADAYGLPVILPQIGCGLAGLDWEADLVPIITTLDEHYNGRVDTTVCLWG